MSLSIGIVGLPNVGKSTIFNALCKSELAEVANYAFTTIEPNVGVVAVPDARVEKLAEIEKCPKTIPATIKFIDIAGLISGAHKGEGLGNKFLAHIREVDAICHIVRIFEDKEVAHINAKISPKDDIETVMTELILADLETLQKRKNESASWRRKSADPKALAAYKKIEAVFEKGLPASQANLDEDEKELIREANFLTLKPFLYVFNVGEEKASEEPADLIEKFELPKLIRPEAAIVISAKVESELNSLNESEREEYYHELGLEEPGLNKLVRSAYKTLNLISFFTFNEKEARAWTLKRGENVLAAAGKVHTDFEKKFIKAEVISFADFVASDGWQKAKETGKVRLEGRDYQVKDGEVVYIYHG